MKDFNTNYLPISKKKNELTIARLSLLVIGGLVVGFIAGLFGGGGGIIVVPLLTSVARLSEREAHATSIAIVLPIAIVAMTVYLVMGTTVDYTLGVLITVGVLIGGLIGTFLLRKLSGTAIRIAFYLIMIVAGVKMLI